MAVTVTVRGRPLRLLVVDGRSTVLLSRTPFLQGVAAECERAAGEGRPYDVVVGDFNAWEPGVHTLVRRSNGTRSVKVTVPVGETFRFRYLGENGHWFDDPQVEHRDWQDGLLLT